MLKKSKLYSKIIVILLALVCNSALAQKFQLEYNNSLMAKFYQGFCNEAQAKRDWQWHTRRGLA